MSTALPFLYAIANLDSHQNPLMYIERLIIAGVRIVQLRSKQMSRTDFEQIARRSVMLANIQSKLLAENIRIIINDIPEICLSCQAHGVHLGQSDCSPEIARKMLGADVLIGLSTHNLEDVRQAPIAHLNYLGFGPVFPSTTKSGHAPVTGLAALREATLNTTLPIVAIGGINSKNAKLAYENGASSVAVISDLEQCEDLVKKTDEYLI